MKYLSVCSGIEAVSVAWHQLGWEAFAYSEIEKFPCAVLQHHYPQTPNFGDMTNFKEWPDANVDVLVGGTPCQSFSIAGLRKGLDDPRGNLMLTYLAIADKYRPKWILWENVPGVLSSNGGRDFGSLLGGLAKLGYGFAYRVLDAQYVRTDGYPYAVPQRRRRVFVVGHIGSWQRAAAVLFDRESLSGNPPPSRRAGQKATANAGTGTTCSGKDTFGTLMANVGTKQWLGNQEALSGDYHVFAMAGNTVGRQPLNGGNGNGYDDGGASYTLTKTDVHAVAFYENHPQDSRVTELVGACSTVTKNWGTGGGNVPFVQMIDTLYNKGLNQQGYEHASTQKGNSREILLRVRKEIGEKSFAEWGLGILNSLQEKEILQQVLHGKELRQASFTRSWVVCCALGSPFSCSEGALQSLRECCGERCSSQGWESLKQLSGELGAYLSKLSQPGPQAEIFMCDLWQASEGIGLLREALSEVQKIRRPSSVKRQSVCGSEERGNCECAESLQGGGVSIETPLQRILCETCATSKAGDTWSETANEIRVREQKMAVRRLTTGECTFLQGFPDDYLSQVPGASDSAMYKALGNSMAVNVMQLLGERIAMVDAIADIKAVA